jgi:hypothetical protein
MTLEFIRYPNESDLDFAYRIRQASNKLGYKLLDSNACDPENTIPSVQLRKTTTDNGTRYKYETNKKR